MRTFGRLLLKEFLPFLAVGVLFFALILVMADIFTNLWKYLNRDIGFFQAFYVSILYAPRALSFALPIGSMFAAAFALGNLGSRNELIAVFGAGVSLWRFVIPIMVWAVLLSLGGYMLEDRVAIPLMRERSQVSKELLGMQDSRSRSRAVAIARGGRVVYYADYYNDESRTLTGVTVIEMRPDGGFLKRIDAERATWDDSGTWLLEAVRVFRDDGTKNIIQERYERYREPLIDESPETFQLDTRELDEMTSAEARQWINTQKRVGLPYKALQAEYYQRFTMSLTPFLVVFFAAALGGRFKRNVLLLSLLSSLGLSVSWYIVRMISTLLAELGMIPPIASAVVPFIGFLLLGVWLFKQART